MNVKVVDVWTAQPT